MSDGALSQAIRILRRTLDDDARDPRFIRTVPRHGYQFVWMALEEQPDEGQLAAGAGQRRSAAARIRRPRQSSRLRSTRWSTSCCGSRRQGLPSRDDARDVAERLHASGTADAVAHLIGPAASREGARPAARQPLARAGRGAGPAQGRPGPGRGPRADTPSPIGHAADDSGPMGRGSGRGSDWRGLGRRVRGRGAAPGAVLDGAARGDRRALDRRVHSRRHRRRRGGGGSRGGRGHRPVPQAAGPDRLRRRGRGHGRRAGDPAAARAARHVSRPSADARRGRCGRPGPRRRGGRFVRAGYATAAGWRRRRAGRAAPAPGDGGRWIGVRCRGRGAELDGLPDGGGLRARRGAGHARR